MRKRTLLSRRAVLGGFAAVGLTAGPLAPVACGGSSEGPPPDADAPAPSASSTSAAAGSRPNVLFILLDQERSERFAPAGLLLSAHAEIAARGTTLTRHYANAMPCTPSRSVLYTGQHVPKTKMTSNVGMNQESMSPELPTLGTMLKALGYGTAYVGKWHLSEIDAGRDCAKDTSQALVPYGFDRYDPCGDIVGTWWSGYRDDPGVAKRAADFLAQWSPADGPFALAVNFVNPHDIMYYYPRDLAVGPTYLAKRIGFDVPAGATSYARRWNVTLPPTVREDRSTKPPAHAAYMQMYDAIQSYEDSPNVSGDDLRRAYLDYYYDCLADVDRHLATVLAALDASPHAANTVVVLTSDRGELAFSHGMRGKGPFVYEENNHVPFVVAGPGIPSGARVDALSSHVDVVPTLLALVGEPIEAARARWPALAGQDLSGVVRGGAAGPRRELLMTFDMGGPAAGGSGSSGEAATQLDTLAVASGRPLLRGMTDGRYKFARYFASGDYHVPRTWEELLARNDLELYDLQNDPLEQDNLARDAQRHRVLIEDLNGRLNRLVEEEAGGELSA